MATINVSGASLGNALSDLLMCDDLQPGDSPSYQVCKTIYTNHPLGGKMAEAPVAMAMSQPRDISIPNSGAEDQIKRAFQDEWAACGADTHIYQQHTLKRVYGIASLAVVERGKDAAEPLNLGRLWDGDIAFNVLDPLNTAGSLVGDLNPNSPGFLKTRDIVVNGQAYHRSRSTIALNGQPIYLAYSNSAFGYVGRSSYQAGFYLLKSFIETMIADAMVAKKAGVLIAMIEQAGSIIDGVMGRMFGVKRQVLKDAKTDNVISISTKEKIESLNLQNVNGAMDASRKHILENLAASDNMPALLLNNETFAEGFGEGTEDAKRVARYIDRFRVGMEPSYRFMTKIVQHRAWNPEFYAALQGDFPGYRGVAYQDAFYRWKNSFVATWPSLLTEPDSEKAKVDDIRLKAIIAIVQVLLPQLDPDNKATLLQWCCDNFSEFRLLFPAPLTLDLDALRDWTPPAPSQEEPAEPRPFAAQDAAVAPIDMLRRAARLSRAPA